MAKNKECHARVQRFLTGDFNPADLTALYLFLRGNSYGKDSVRDLGNMIGHADLRNKGISVDRVSAMYKIAKYKIPRMGPDVSKAGPVVLSALIDAMNATLSLLSDEKLILDTQMRRGQVSAVWAKLRDNFTANGSGNLEWKEHQPSPKEQAVFKCLTSYIISEPTYTPECLFEETKSLLIRHNFMELGQAHLLDAKKSYLTLFALSVMHGVKFLLPDQAISEASAGWSTEGGSPRLTVSATVEVFFAGKNLDLSFSLFSTDLHPEDWTRDFDPMKRHSVWIQPIELTSEPKIRCIE